jgi:hypothetical protein
MTDDNHISPILRFTFSLLWYINNGGILDPRTYGVRANKLHEGGTAYKAMKI